MTRVRVSMDRDCTKPAAGDSALERLRGPKIGIALAGASPPARATGFLHPVVALGEGALRGRGPTSSLNNGRTRRKLLRRAAEGQVKLRNLPVCEITGVETGTPRAAHTKTAAGETPTAV